MIIRKQTERLTCLTLLDLAKTDLQAYTELRKRAASWSTCALGDAAKKIGVDHHALLDIDIDLNVWGTNFYDTVNCRQFARAKRLYSQIERRVNKLFGTKAKQRNAGLIK